MTLQVITGWRDLPETLKGAAAAIGAFDGVHRGHQAVIASARAAAERLDAPLAVVTFDPHPRRWFQPEAAPFRLMTPDQMARALEPLGVQRLYLLAFDAQMAAMTDTAFARDVLAGPKAARSAVGPEDRPKAARSAVGPEDRPQAARSAVGPEDRPQATRSAIGPSNGLGLQHVAVGFDFTYGKGRSGSPDALAQHGKTLGFTVSVTQRIDDADGLKLSSSAVREALHAGDMTRAAAILGRPFAIQGPVIHGEKRGRTIGVPTANIALGDYMRPAYGVYATRTRLADGRVVDGVANLGIRPMFEIDQPLLEVWLLDFTGDLYGQTVETELVALLRGEMNFDGLDALKAQIDRDAAAARRVLRP